MKKTNLFLWKMLFCLFNLFMIPFAKAQTSQVSFAHSTTVIRLKVVWIADNCGGVKWGQTNVCAGKTIIPSKTVHYTFHNETGVQVAILNKNNSVIQKIKGITQIKKLIIFVGKSKQPTNYIQIQTCYKKGVTRRYNGENTLKDFLISELKLVAVIPHKTKPFAVIEDPFHRAFYARIGTKIGINGYVEKILRNSIIIKRKVNNKTEYKKIRINICKCTLLPKSLPYFEAKKTSKKLTPNKINKSDAKQ